MKVLRFDSVGGAAGDMLLGALIGLGVDPAQLQAEIASLLPKESFAIEISRVTAYGINDGIRTTVSIEPHRRHGGEAHGHQPEHRTFRDIRELIDRSALPPPVKEMSIQVFAALAEAEGEIHGLPADQIHFHEIGAVDSIVDIVGCCLAYHRLEIDKISVSPLPTGSGTFTCRHGQYPLPAPATLEMLRHGGLVSVPTDEPYELLTPTGAALLAVWPKNELSAGGRIVGCAYSFGHRELKNRPNLLRASIYETNAGEVGVAPHPLTVLETNIDDCTPEIIAYAFDQLLKAGALDVWTVPAQMKKQRGGTLLCILCETTEKQRLLEIVLTETTTFGVREYTVQRHCLERNIEEIDTVYGKVRVKVGRLNGQVASRTPEFEDCAKLAARHQVPVKIVYHAAVH